VTRPDDDAQQRVSFARALRTWAYVGLNSFGGPAGQIALMHRELVERRRWIDERRFLSALNYCMLLPGPEAQQLATYIGWMLHGVRGGLAAGLLFILPGVAVMLGLAVLYALFQETMLAEAVFYGVKPAVVALVADAVVRLSRRAISGRVSLAIAVGAFVAIFFFDIWFPLIVGAAALIGVGLARANPRPVAADGRSDTVESSRPDTLRALATGAACLVAWLAPVAICVALLEPGHVYTQLALFFSFAAVITFGGAYAVLAYIAQQAVDVYGWLAAGQMVDGLGLAETTPGPLILVVQFVGFIAAFGQPGGLDPLTAGVAGGLLVSWVTFAPSFLWIFVGAPYVEYFHRRPALAAALSGITPAVVGVIVNLAAWFALQTFFATTGELRIGFVRLHTVDFATVDPFAIALAVGAFVALVRLRLPLLLVLAACAGIGAAGYLVAGAI
jgi:chromate transporter